MQEKAIPSHVWFGSGVSGFEGYLGLLVVGLEFQVLGLGFQGLGFERCRVLKLPLEALEV